MLQELFINFCIMITLTLVGGTVVNAQPDLPRDLGRKLLYWVGGVASGWVLMQFSVRLPDGVILAFHAVFPALAGMYGGPVWGQAVALPLAVYRIWLKGFGAYPGAAHILLAGLVAGLLAVGGRGFARRVPTLLWRALLIFLPADAMLLLIPVHGVSLFREYFLLLSASHAAALVAVILVLRTRFAAMRNLELMTDLSLTDHLTGLANLRAFEEAVSRMSSLDSGSFLLLDVDHFKLVNDKHGHLNGDKVLRVVADILKSELRQSDLICRYGGEEFAVLMRGCPPDQAVDVADRIRQAIARRGVTTAKGLIRVTVSGGLVAFDPAADFKRQFESADHLLYQAKAQGRDRIVFHGQEQA